MKSIASSTQHAVLSSPASYNILILGPEPYGLKERLAGSDTNYQVEYIENLSSFPYNSIEPRQVQHYECLIINLIDAVDATYLKLASILASNMGKSIIVLSPEDRLDLVEALPSVEEVFTAPVSNKALIEKLDQLAVAENCKEETQSPIEAPAEAPTEAKVQAKSKPEFEEQTAKTTIDDICEKQEAPVEEPKSGVTTGFETSISTVVEVDQTIWRKFLPLVNFVYKKTAILILTALFLTFLCYGTMIVFFLSSSNWTLPFSLSAGNKMVEKVERDLSQLQFTQNNLRQTLAANTTKITIAQRKVRESELLTEGLAKTIKNEIQTQRREKAKLQLQTARLKQVESEITKSRKETSLDDYYAGLKKAHKNKVVSRRLLEGVRVSILEAQHLLATIRNDIADKTERANLAHRRKFALTNLLTDLKNPDLSVAPNMGSQFAHFANELVAAHTTRISAESEYKSALKGRYQIQNTLKRASNNIERLEKTPLARAMKAPVAVLFVPYQNNQGAKEGDPLYGCSFFIFKCEEVGKLGARVDGETVASHPMFEKPMRGYFVEAKFDEQHTATEDLIHIGSKPFLF